VLGSLLWCDRLGVLVQQTKFYLAKGKKAWIKYNGDTSMWKMVTCAYFENVRHSCWCRFARVVIPDLRIGWGLMKWLAVSVCLSVCLSVCCVPRSNSRTQRPRWPKISTMEAHHTSNRWSYLEVKRSTVKVTRQINADTDNAPYGERREFPCRKRGNSVK